MCHADHDVTDLFTPRRGPQWPAASHHLSRSTPVPALLVLIPLIKRALHPPQLLSLTDFSSLDFSKRKKDVWISAGTDVDMSCERVWGPFSSFLHHFLLSTLPLQSEIRAAIWECSSRQLLSNSRRSLMWCFSQQTCLYSFFRGHIFLMEIYHILNGSTQILLHFQMPEGDNNQDNKQDMNMIHVSSSWDVKRRLKSKEEDKILEKIKSDPIKILNKILRSKQWTKLPTNSTEFPTFFNNNHQNLCVNLWFILFININKWHKHGQKNGKAWTPPSVKVMIKEIVVIQFSSDHLMDPASSSQGRAWLLLIS